MGWFWKKALMERVSGLVSIRWFGGTRTEIQKQLGYETLE